jgi:hypothetical protein
MAASSIPVDENNTVFALDSTSSGTLKLQDGAPELGAILEDNGFDRDGDGLYDELIIKFEVTSPDAGQYQLGGWLRVGDIAYSLSTIYATLVPGTSD